MLIIDFKNFSDTNMYLANLARDLIIKNNWIDDRNANDFQQYWPVLFGMKFENMRWINISRLFGNCLFLNLEKSNTFFKNVYYTVF